MESYGDVWRYVTAKLVADEATTQVWSGIDRRTGEKVAIKIPKSGCTQTAAEAQFLPQLNHDHIIRLRDVLDMQYGPALVYPYAEGGDLFNFIGTHGKLDEGVTKIVIYALLQALAYLHGKNLVHMDIKPENILLMSGRPDSVVLADFGMAGDVSNGISGEEANGSLPYCSPEIFHKQRVDTRSDIWSLGITMFACLTNALPFRPGSYEGVRADIMSGLPNLLRMGELAHLSNNARIFMRSLLRVSPETRPTAEQLLQHPWFEDIRGREVLSVPTGFDLRNVLRNRRIHCPVTTS
jgi:serine/threonine protein kinase